MRFAMDGAPCVGKTTTATALALVLTQLTGEHYQFSGNFGKGVLIDHHGTPTIYNELNPHQHLELSLELLRRKRIFESLTENLIADKSILGNFGELLIQCKDVIDPYIFAQLLDECVEHCRKYDAIFVLQHGSIPLKDDGIRPQNPLHNLQVEITGRGLYHKYGIEVVDIFETTLEGRVEAILQNLESPDLSKRAENILLSA